MALYDAESGEIVVRIVYDGLGTAGKTTNLRMLHAAFVGRARSEVLGFGETRTGRTLYFDWLELSAGHIDETPLRCQVLSVPGQFAHAHRRFHLLREIDGAVLVCDSTERGVLAGTVAMDFLQRALVASGNTAAPIVLQANKQDLPGALSPEMVAAAMPVTPHAVVPASATSSDGVRLTLLRALDLVRGSVRARLGGREAATLPPAGETAEALYAALDRVDGSEDDAQLVHALEAALLQVK